MQPCSPVEAGIFSSQWCLVVLAYSASKPSMGQTCGIMLLRRRGAFVGQGHNVTHGGPQQCTLLTEVSAWRLIRPEDLATLAAELCNMGLFTEHAVVVRRAVELALARAGEGLGARHLANLAMACGVIGIVPRASMEVWPPALTERWRCQWSPWACSA